jgi:hypothetical protein
MEYILVQDSDCHWYVIPNNKNDDWCEWCEIDSDDERAWTPPEYAEEIGGCPSLVKFKEYRIE